MMMSRLLTCWYKLDKYYTLTDQSPICAAAVLLHPVLRKAYLDENWKGKTRWIKAAVDAARLLWQREYKTTQQEQQQIDEPHLPYKEWRDHLRATTRRLLLGYRYRTSSTSSGGGSTSSGTVKIYYASCKVGSTSGSNLDSMTLSIST